MNRPAFVENLGEPDLAIAGLRIWVHGRQFPDSEDYWDGNWLNVSVCCSALGAEVWTNGSILHMSEVAGWLSSCIQVNKTLSGQANLETMESEIHMKLSADSLGHLGMEVQITPNISEQEHTFRFDIDQSFLSALIAGLKRVVELYPIKGHP